MVNKRRILELTGGTWMVPFLFSLAVATQHAGTKQLRCNMHGWHTMRHQNWEQIAQCKTLGVITALGQAWYAYSVKQIVWQEWSECTEELCLLVTHSIHPNIVAMRCYQRAIPVSRVNYSPEISRLEEKIHFAILVCSMKLHVHTCTYMYMYDWDCVECCSLSLVGHEREALAVRGNWLACMHGKRGRSYAHVQCYTWEWGRE